MADIASPSQPRSIPGAGGLKVSPPGNLGGPSPGRSFRMNQLTLDTFSPVTQNGSFEFDRIVKQGEVLKRTRKTKSWKPIYMVLRPNLLSIYRDKKESKLRHQINLSDLTAIARQKDPKRKDKHVFGLFSPSRNYHLEAYSDADAQDWVEKIRLEARIDEEEEEMYLASPGGAKSPYQGFERSIDARIHPQPTDVDTHRYSSSDFEALSPSLALPRQRDRRTAGTRQRQPSFAEYSGPEQASFSDISDPGGAAARLSALSLTPTDGRPSTSSATRPHLQPVASTSSARPSLGGRSTSQMSVAGIGAGLSAEDIRRAQNPGDEERVVYHGWIYLLKSKSGVRQWKKVWLVLRARALALYKNEEEYAASLVLPLKDVIDAVEIDPISRSKTTCMQIITEDRNYRFCTLDEESLTKCLGALKSLLARRKAKQKELENANVPPVTVGPPPS